MGIVGSEISSKEVGAAIEFLEKEIQEIQSFQSSAEKGKKLGQFLFDRIHPHPLPFSNFTTVLSKGGLSSPSSELIVRVQQLMTAEKEKLDPPTHPPTSIKLSTDEHKEVIDPIADLKDDNKGLDQHIMECKTEDRELNKQNTELHDDDKQLNQKIAELENGVEELNKQITEDNILNKQITELKDDDKELNKQITELKDDDKDLNKQIIEQKQQQAAEDGHADHNYGDSGILDSSVEKNNLQTENVGGGGGEGEGEDNVGNLLEEPVLQLVNDNENSNNEQLPRTNVIEAVIGNSQVNNLTKAKDPTDCNINDGDDTSSKQADIKVENCDDLIRSVNGDHDSVENVHMALKKHKSEFAEVANKADTTNVDDENSNINEPVDGKMLILLSKINNFAKKVNLVESSTQGSVSKINLSLTSITESITSNKSLGWPELSRDLYLLCNNIIANNSGKSEVKNAKELLKFIKKEVEVYYRPQFKNDEDNIPARNLRARKKKTSNENDVDAKEKGENTSKRTSTRIRKSKVAKKAAEESHCKSSKDSQDIEGDRRNDIEQIELPLAQKNTDEGSGIDVSGESGNEDTSENKKKNTPVKKNAIVSPKKVGKKRNTRKAEPPTPRRASKRQKKIKKVED